MAAMKCRNARRKKRDFAAPRKMRPSKRKSMSTGRGETVPPVPARPAMRLEVLKPDALPRSAKILVIDIETCPIEGYVWSTWKQTLSLEQIKTDWSILSYAAKWVGRRELIYADTGGRGADKVRDDHVLLPGIWQLMHEADVVVAQNGNKFDIKKINYRLAEAKFLPYSPVQAVDTLVTSRKKFAATSHKLGWLSEKLTDTPKSKHRKFPGMELWLECLKDNPAAWREMRKYNCQDIRATEKLYLRQRPWMSTHPRIGAPGACPKCGSANLREDNCETSGSSDYARFQCGACGGWSRAKKMLTSVEHRRKQLVPL